MTLINPCDGCGYLTTAYLSWEHPIETMLIITIIGFVVLRVFGGIKWIPS